MPVYLLNTSDSSHFESITKCYQKESLQNFKERVELEATPKNELMSWDAHFLSNLILLVF